MNRKSQNLHLFEPSKALKGHKGPIYVAKFNNDGQYLMTGSQDRSIILWNPYRELQLKEYSGAHNYEILDIAISSDNSKFISCGGDKSAYLWDVQEGAVLKKFGQHNTRINCVAIGGETSICATGGYDCVVNVWDMKDKKALQPIQKIKEFSDSVTQIIFEGHHMVTSSIDGHIRTFDLRKGQITEDYVKQGILSFGVSYDSKLLSLSCTDSKIRILERNSGQVLSVLEGAHDSSTYPVQSKFSWNDASIITGSEDGRMVIYDILTAKCTVNRKLHDKCLSSLDLSSQKNAFVTASYDNVALLWTEYAH